MTRAPRHPVIAVVIALSSLLWAVTPGASSAGVATLGSCGWLLRVDPAVVNVLYPDEDATYYLAALPAPPPGVTYRIRGEFPHARYMSFVAYDGLPIDVATDVDLRPDPGSGNPFLLGADRTMAARSYTVEIIPESPPDDPAQREPGALYIGPGQLGLSRVAFYILYRIYVPDAGTDLRGGVPLPQIELVTEGLPSSLDLSRVTLCEDLRDALPAGALNELQALVSRGAFPIDLPPRSGATDPPTWEVESGLTAALLGTVDQGGLVDGGPASNPDNRYIATELSRAHGEIAVIHARAPIAFTTRNGEPVMGMRIDSGGQTVGGQDLRYWSICQNSITTRFVACLSDDEIDLNPDGTFTVVVSVPAHRPQSARNWIPFGIEPDGLLIYRHMLPSAEFFPFSAQGAAAAGRPPSETMGEYFPIATYCTTAEFDAGGCSTP